jgi:hypothetical protein
MTASLNHVKEFVVGRGRKRQVFKMKRRKSQEKKKLRIKKLMEKKES